MCLPLLASNMCDAELAALASLVERNEGIDPALGALRTAALLLKNAAADKSKGVLRADNKALRSKILGLDGGAAALHALGFRADVEDPEQATTFSLAASSSTAAALAEAVGKAVARVVALKDAIVAVGDSNAPQAAQDALRLAATYVTNLASDAANERKRRIGAANKALASRLLGASGGAALLFAAGFAPEPAEAPEAFVCALPAAEVGLVAAVLGRADGIWAALAAARGGGGVAGEEAAGEPSPSEAVTSVPRFATLPLVDALCAGGAPPGGADMQPKLAKARDGQAVVLLCWQSASKRWSRVGQMPIPSTSFAWAQTLPDGSEPALSIDVDLGDGKLLELRAGVGGGDNEYLAAKRFIDANWESLNNNHLEEIARKVRAAVGPVLATVEALRDAMEAQN